MGRLRIKRIGVMGGTFDPIHNGHLVTAEEAWKQFNLDQVLFVPSGSPPHKEDRKSLDPESRYLMAVIATAANPHFKVSRMEIDRPGPSYTIDTVHELHRVYGRNTEVFFITGADAILEILTWKEPEKVLREAIFIAATRPGYDLRDWRSRCPRARRRGRHRSEGPGHEDPGPGHIVHGHQEGERGGPSPTSYSRVSRNSSRRAGSIFEREESTGRHL